MDLPHPPPRVGKRLTAVRLVSLAGDLTTLGADVARWVNELDKASDTGDSAAVHDCDLGALPGQSYEKGDCGDEKE
jgi:hypothetical protein